MTGGGNTTHALEGGCDANCMRLGSLRGGKAIGTHDDALADLDHVTASDRRGEVPSGQSMFIAANCCNGREHAWIHAVSVTDFAGVGRPPSTASRDHRRLCSRNRTRNRTSGGRTGAICAVPRAKWVGVVLGLVEG